MTYQGLTIPVVSFPPDWSGNVTLSVRHKTKVFEALDLSEERHKQFPRPLYGISFATGALSPREQGTLRKIFETAQNLPVAVPLWTEAVRLTGSISAGASALPVIGAASTLLSIFSYAIVWSDWKTFEVVQLAGGATDISLPLVGVTANGWPASTIVAPLPIGSAQRPDFSGISAESSTVPIQFEEVFNRQLSQTGAQDA